MEPAFTSYWKRLNELHTEIKKSMDGLPAAALDWSPGPELNSIAVLATHIAGSERFWIGERVGGRPAHRDRPAEFQAKGQDAAALGQKLDDAGRLAAEVLEGLSLDDLTRSAGERPGSGEPVDVAWALAHALAHAAEHVGHVQMTRHWWESD